MPKRRVTSGAQKKRPPIYTFNFGKPLPRTHVQFRKVPNPETIARLLKEGKIVSAKVLSSHEGKEPDIIWNNVHKEYVVGELATIKLGERALDIAGHIIERGSLTRAGGTLKRESEGAFRCVAIIGFKGPKESTYSVLFKVEPGVFTVVNPVHSSFRALQDSIKRRQEK